MSDLIRLAMYGGGAVAVSALLYMLYSSGAVSGSMVGVLAIILVIVLPVVASVIIANRERDRDLTSGDE